MLVFKEYAGHLPELFCWVFVNGLDNFSRNTSNHYSFLNILESQSYQRQRNHSPIWTPSITTALAPPVNIVSDPNWPALAGSMIPATALAPTWLLCRQSLGLPRIAPIYQSWFPHHFCTDIDDRPHHDDSIVANFNLVTDNSARWALMSRLSKSGSTVELRASCSTT